MRGYTLFTTGTTSGWKQRVVILLANVRCVTLGEPLTVSVHCSCLASMSGLFE